MGALLANPLSTQPPPASTDVWSPARFVVYDGIDGSGKGTHVGVLTRLLKIMRVPFIQTKQPGGSAYGDEVRRILFETVGTTNIAPDALELLFMSNHAHNCALIKDALAQGKWVVADRWSPSAIAYMHQRSANSRIQQWYRMMLEEVPWDAFFLLTGDPAILLERARARTSESHQSAKKWNSVEAMSVINEAFLREFANDSRTKQVRTDLTTTENEFRIMVLPTLRELGLFPKESQVKEAVRVQ